MMTFLMMMITRYLLPIAPQLTTQMVMQNQDAHYCLTLLYPHPTYSRSTIIRNYQRTTKKSAIM